MKILSLHIKNMNSLKGEHTVRFDEGTLSESGLFAITGPTGSGKSTLLDAITLALFNRIPRLTGQSKITKKVVEEQGAILTQHTKEALAEVEYSSHGKRYRSSWSIAVNRNGNLNDRQMELVDAQTGEIITSNANEVVEKNQEIIGLSYEQFVQSIILAQGKFDELLKAGEHERNKLLEELTGGHIYRKIGIRVYQRARKIESEIKSVEDKLGEVKVLPEEERNVLEKNLKEKAPQLTQLKASLEKIREKLKIKEQIKQLQQQHKKVEDQISEHKKLGEEVQPLIEKLEVHQKLSPSREVLQEFDRLTKEQQKLTEELKELKEQEQQIQDKQNEFLKETKHWLGKDVEPENVETAIQQFEKEIDKEQEQLKMLNRDVHQLNDKIDDRVVSMNRMGIDFERSEQTLEKAKELQQELEQKTADHKVENEAALKERIDELEKSLSTLELIVEKRSRVEDKQGYLKQNTERLEQNSQKIQQLEKSVAEYQKKLEEIRPQLETAQKKWEQFESAQKLEAHRAELKEGEPCPLCGSEHHPCAKHFEVEKTQLLKQDHERLKELVEQVEKSEREAKADYKVFSLKVKELEESLKPTQKELKELQTEIKELTSQFKATPEKSDLDSWKQFRTQKKTQLSELQKLQQQLRALPILRELQELQIKYTEQRKNYTNQREKLKVVYSGHDIRKDASLRQRKWNNLQKDSAHVKEYIQKTSKASDQNKEQLTQKENELNKFLQQHRLPGLNELRSKLLSDEQQQQFRKQIEDYRKQKDTLQGAQKSINEQLKTLSEQDKSEKSLEELKAELEVLSKKAEELQTAITSIKVNLENDDKTKKRHGELNQELKRHQKDQQLWNTMNKLIGDATGNKFANFVQDLTLRQLIHYGNERLNSFEDRYQIAAPDPKNRDALRIIDRHLGNTERSVASLSGGETFKVSLALALGLSDLAAREVRIDSLFIDEGFGTLDPESLDMAITLLEQMQSESNKSIGIISHVTDLKDRIGAKVKLIPDGNGYSRVEVE